MERHFPSGTFLSNVQPARPGDDPERPSRVADAANGPPESPREDSLTGLEDGPTPRVEVYPNRWVHVDFDLSLTFECVDDCSWCCRHGVLLYDADLIALAERASLAETTTQFRATSFVRRERKSRDDHVDEDGYACAFLDADGRCTLHAEHDWKPTRCSIFPLAVSLEDDGLHVDVRDSAHTHCEGLDVGDRRVIDSLEAFLPELLWELECPDSDVRL